MTHPVQTEPIHRIEDLPPGAKRVFIVSLGCPKNLVDTERHLAMLVTDGYRLVNDPSEADLLFINTCSFIDTAKQESVDAILELVDAKDEGQALVVAGCLVDRYPEELKTEIPEVDLWLDTKGFSAEEGLLRTLQPGSPPAEFHPIPLSGAARATNPVPWAGFSRVSLTPAHTAYLKISEGCDHRCTFCSIPSFKGKHRSVPIDMLLAEAQSLAERGAREITLIGQDIISYGKDLSKDRSLNIGVLLRELNAIDGLEWIRLLYTYPTRLADELESAYSNLDKMIPYLDLPLQHLSDRVLERMKRGTPYAEIANHLKRLRRAAPSLVVRSTCIVGFPGETEEDYRLLMERFAEVEVDHLGVFRYSDEDGTGAFDHGEKVPFEIAEERHHEMTEWAAEYCQRRASRRLRETIRVLVDGPTLPPVEVFPDIDPSGRWLQGRWYGQAPEIDGVVYFRGDTEPKPGNFLDLRIENVSYPDYLATPLPRDERLPPRPAIALNLVSKVED